MAITTSPKTAFLLGFLGLCFINLIAAIDSTALSVSLPIIASAFDASSVEAYWAGTSFVLASAVFVPLFPAFSNAFGRRPLVLAALALFTVGTIVAGSAQNVSALLAGRTIQGTGGGGMLSMTYVVIADLLPLQKRPAGIAVISLVWLLGTSTGPILGGGFSESSATWRWIFWICLPFAGVSIVLIAAFLQTPHKSPEPGKALFRIDWIGTVLFVAGIASFLVPVSWGGTMYAWSSWHTIVPLVIGVVLLLGWLVYEHLVPAAPLLPLVVLSNRTALAGFIGTLLFGIIQFGILYYLPLYYQICKGYSPVISGVALLAQCAVVGPATAVTGILITKTGNYRTPAWCGWVILILGCGLLVLLEPGSTIPQWLFINIVSGIGLGPLYASLPIAVQAATEQKHMAIAAGLTPFFRNVGQAIGIVMGNSIFQNQLKTALATSENPTLRENASLIVENSAAVRLIKSWLSDPAVGGDLRDAYNESLRMVWWAVFAIACFGGLLSLPMRAFSLQRPDQVGKGGTSAQSEKGLALSVEAVVTTPSTDAGDEEKSVAPLE